MSDQLVREEQAPLLAEDVGRIEGQVLHRLGGQVRNFRIVVHDDGLVLHGRARTYYAKQIAQHAVMAAGLPILANDIEVA